MRMSEHDGPPRFRTPLGVPPPDPPAPSPSGAPTRDSRGAGFSVASGVEARTVPEDLSQTRVDPPRVLLEVGGIGGVPFSASEIRRGVIIGTGPEAQLRLDGKQWPRVSARHALLREREGAVFVEDLDSESGTFVGGIRASYPGVLLKTGTRIALGSDGPTLLVTLPGSPMSTLPGFQSVPKQTTKEEPVAPAETPAALPVAPATTVPEAAALAAIQAVDEGAPTLRKAPVVGQTLLGMPPVMTEVQASAPASPPPSPPTSPPATPAASGGEIPPAKTALGAPALRPLPGMVPAPGDPEPPSRESSGLKNLPRREGSGAGPLPSREGSGARALPSREGSKPPAAPVATREGSKPPATREGARPLTMSATDQPTMPREPRTAPGLMPVPIDNVNEVARAMALKVGAGARTIRLLDAVAAQVQEREQGARRSLRKLSVVLGVLVLLTAVVGGLYWWSAVRREQAARERAWALAEARERERTEAKKRIADAMAEKVAAEKALKEAKEQADREIVATMEATAEQKSELLQRLAAEARAKARELERLQREAREPAEPDPAKPESKPEGKEQKKFQLPPVTKKPPPPPEPEKPELR